MIKMIAAMDRLGAIGYQGCLPWSLPDEEAHFKFSTIGKTIVMGSTSARGLGRALPKRLHLVLTSQTAAPCAGQIPMHSVSEVLEFHRSRPTEELMVCGGERVYQDFLSYADELVLTHVDTRVAAADTFFPIEALRSGDWKMVETILEHPKDERHAYAFKVCRYARRAAL